MIKETDSCCFHINISDMVPNCREGAVRQEKMRISLSRALICTLHECEKRHSSLCEMSTTSVSLERVVLCACPLYCLCPQRQDRIHTKNHAQMDPSPFCCSRLARTLQRNWLVIRRSHQTEFWPLTGNASMACPSHSLPSLPFSDSLSLCGSAVFILLPVTGKRRLTTTSTSTRGQHTQKRSVHTASHSR